MTGAVTRVAVHLWTARSDGEVSRLWSERRAVVGAQVVPHGAVLNHVLQLVHVRGSLGLVHPDGLGAPIVVGLTRRPVSVAGSESDKIAGACVAFLATLFGAARGVLDVDGEPAVVLHVAETEC